MTKPADQNLSPDYTNQAPVPQGQSFFRKESTAEFSFSLFQRHIKNTAYSIWNLLLVLFYDFPNWVVKQSDLLQILGMILMMPILASIDAFIIGWIAFRTTFLLLHALILPFHILVAKISDTIDAIYNKSDSKESMEMVPLLSESFLEEQTTEERGNTVPSHSFGRRNGLRMFDASNDVENSFTEQTNGQSYKQ